VVIGRIGVLGGTGAQGRGMALRWAAAGLDVVLGSRDAAKAGSAALELADQLAGVAGSGSVSGGSNRDAALTDAVLVAVPFDAHRATVADVADDLVDRLVIDCVNPLGFDARGPFVLPVREGSAAQQAQDAVPRARVVGAFHHVSAVLLGDLAVTDLDTDVLVVGEERDDVEAVIALANLLPGVRGLYGGRLRNAGQVEALTANLIALNRRHKTHAGIRITGQGLGPR
jgi:NADPH-dependent F420 reductase